MGDLGDAALCLAIGIRSPVGELRAPWGEGESGGFWSCEGKSDSMYNS